MRTFKTIWFSRFADKSAISNDELKNIVDQLEAGEADANLGGGVFKVRLARPRAGKSGGYRIIVFFRSEERTFFHYGFPKSAQANISKAELKDMKQIATADFALTEDQIKIRLANGTLLEIF